MYLGVQAVKDNYRNSHYVFRSNTDPKITGVMEVGNHLLKALQSQGISVMHHRQIHDWPSLASSYLNSERTVREILQKHPSIKYVLDIHRDANVPEPVVIIDGKKGSQSSNCGWHCPRYTASASKLAAKFRIRPEILWDC